MNFHQVPGNATVDMDKIWWQTPMNVGKSPMMFEVFIRTTSTEILSVNSIIEESILLENV